MKNTLSIGGATFDLFVRTGKALQADEKTRTLPLPLGQKIRVEQVIEACGGGAANTSVGLSRLGMHAHFCGIIGSDQWGERMLKNLEHERVDTASATIIEGETSSFSMIFTVEGGDRTILYDPGTNAHMHDATFDREKASAMDWIYMNHLHERGSIIEDDIVKILETHPSMGLTWNPGGHQLKEGIAAAGNRSLLKHARLFVCNKEEAATFTGASDVQSALRALTDAGARVACICDGKNGSTASDGKKTWHCPIVEDAPVIDTTGAGDAFGTGMTWALLQGLDLPIALRAGTISATCVIAALGAQAGLLTDIEMKKQLESTKLDVEESTV